MTAELPLGSDIVSAWTDGKSWRNARSMMSKLHVWAPTSTRPWPPTRTGLDGVDGGWIELYGGVDLFRAAIDCPEQVDVAVGHVAQDLFQRRVDDGVRFRHVVQHGQVGAYPLREGYVLAASYQGRQPFAQPVGPVQGQQPAEQR